MWLILHRWSLTFFFKETLILVPFVLFKSVRKGVAWARKSICLSSLSFLFLLCYWIIVFLCVVSVVDRLFWEPTEWQKLRLCTYTLQRPGTEHFEVCSLQFFILLKLEERVCGKWLHLNLVPIRKSYVGEEQFLGWFMAWEWIADPWSWSLLVWTLRTS